MLYIRVYTQSLAYVYHLLIITMTFFVEGIERAVKLLNSNEFFPCVNHYNLQMDFDLLIQELLKEESKRLSTHGQFDHGSVHMLI